MVSVVLIAQLFTGAFCLHRSCQHLMHVLPGDTVPWEVVMGRVTFSLVTWGVQQALC